MTLTFRSARIAALVVAVSLGGCYESESPLDPAPQAAVDSALIGTWRCLPLEGVQYIKPATVIVKATQDRRLDVSWQEDGSEAHFYRAYGSSARVPGLLNIQPLNDRGAVGKWVFHRYSVLRPGVVQLQYASNKSLETVDKSPAALRAAIERLQGDPALFQDFVVCVRAKDAK
jgi:hypothetical protein